MSQYLAFVALVSVLVLIPGPAVMLVVHRAISQGFRSAMAVSGGVLTADLVWAAAAALGVTAVLVASEPAFLALRLVGAAYLVYLGLRLLLARKDALLWDAPAADGPVPRARHAASFRRGFLCDMTNPKTVIAFTSVIPQFLGPDAHVLMPTVLGLTFAGLGFLSLLLYATLLSRPAQALRRPRLQRGLIRGSGAALIGFGGGLAYEAFES